MTLPFAYPLPTPPATLGAAHSRGAMVGTTGAGASSWLVHDHVGGAVVVPRGLPEMPAAGTGMPGAPASSIAIPPLPAAATSAPRVAASGDGTASPPHQRSARADRQGDFTDADLAAALAPLLANAASAPADLEPMLRTTVRRALAEHNPQSRPFRQPGWLDRMGWHMRALVTSRSYEDIIFEKTHRFQVEEVYLFDLRTFAMISFASCDPARHGSARRVESTSRRSIPCSRFLRIACSSRRRSADDSHPTQRPPRSRAAASASTTKFSVPNGFTGSPSWTRYSQIFTGITPSIVDIR